MRKPLGFETHRVTTDGVTIVGDVGGSGPPLLLLHGYPQDRTMWREVAPHLAESYTVVQTDLRGYGESDKPRTDETNREYSKRTMAADQVAFMADLGFDRFAVCGHDRGARVTHRMCRDFQDVVAAACVVDIVPTLHLFEHTDKPFADAYYHWFFLAQKPYLPERLIGGASRDFMAMTLDRWSGPDFSFDGDDFDHYAQMFTDDVIHASCNDYRAASTIDLDHDRSDPRRVECPLLVVWGLLGAMERLFDVPATWNMVARDVRPAPIRSGHFVPEEATDDFLAALNAFLSETYPS